MTTRTNLSLTRTRAPPEHAQAEAQRRPTPALDRATNEYNPDTGRLNIGLPLFYAHEEITLINQLFSFVPHARKPP